MQRQIRFWSRHRILLNVTLCGIVWLLYGDLELWGYGPKYFVRAQDFWLKNEWPGGPGIENVLLPGVAAGFREAWMAAGFEFTATTFMLVAAVPFVLFIWALTAFLARRGPNGPLIGLAAAMAMYASGMIPYMTTLGGSVDGMLYLTLLPAVVWPHSFAVFAATALLQCLNHYAGLLVLVLFALVWHTLQAIERPAIGAGFRYWLTTFVPRALLSVGMLMAFMWFWKEYFPEYADVRQGIIEEKWRKPAMVLHEAAGPFPWTLLSTLKLSFIPIVAAMSAPHPRRWLRALALAAPLVAAAGIVFVFLDVTRMATMMAIPALLITLRIAGGDLAMPPRWRSRVRRRLLTAAALSLLIPNYYVNNGAVLIPPSQAIRSLISMYVR
jgi:hypothetical protein